MAKTTGTDAHRDRILKAALALLTKHGRDAVTTRNVAGAAKVQPPVLYRLFGDKNGLLDAVAAFGFTAYLAKKQPPGVSDDPVETLRTGWNLHVEFGLTNPELYLLMYGKAYPTEDSPAARQAFGLLMQHIQLVAAAGQLRQGLEKACAMYHAAAVGVVLSLLATPLEQRDPSLSAAVRDHMLSGITTNTPSVATPTAAIMANRFRALLSHAPDNTNQLSAAERMLLLEWLKRLASGE